MTLATPPDAHGQRLEDQPVFTPYTEKPQIKDRAASAEVMCRHRPKSLGRARQPRPAQLWVFIDVTETVRNAVLHESSGDEAIDRAALTAVRALEFTPARNRGKIVPVWVAVPIDFSYACEKRTLPVLVPISHEPPPARAGAAP